ncbi:MAG: hypothetical protein LH679_23430, partial [Cyanobacteria bacterium CAN_BIN43]|nr:hypothetical protein [Cyanobacteria bacterium CAN_BIN43]
GKDAGEGDDLSEVDRTFNTVFKARVDLVGSNGMSADNVLEHRFTLWGRSYRRWGFTQLPAQIQYLAIGGAYAKEPSTLV